MLLVILLLLITTIVLSVQSYFQQGKSQGENHSKVFEQVLQMGYPFCWQHTTSNSKSHIKNRLKLIGTQKIKQEYVVIRIFETKLKTQTKLNPYKTFLLVEKKLK